MIHEHDMVALTVDLPEFDLRRGDVGVVVDITSTSTEVTLEFFTSDGESFAVVSLPAASVRALDDQDRTIERVIRAG